ncbi:MAG TPA: hypothetical protein VGD99_02845 [Anaerolineae bacterium]|jgi:hypothetical protein
MQARYHRQAAMTYVGLGILVIIITIVAGLTPAGRSNALLELGIGSVFIILFAVLIYRGWWLVSALLVISNSWRAVTYFNDGIGRHMELRPFSITPIEPQPVAFINAVLMVVIVVMLARSAWAGYGARYERQETPSS